VRDNNFFVAKHSECVSSVKPIDSTAKSDLDLVDVHTMPKKKAKTAAATGMGPQTRSRKGQNTVGEAPLLAKQEESNMQAAFAQSAAEQGVRTLARDTLSRQALLYNLKIVEKGGSGHCLPYSIEHQLSQQGIVGHTMQILRPDIADFIGDCNEIGLR
jgi:hypothetical protein